MYTYKDLLWAKNVTRNKGLDWAYMQYNRGDSFFLNWSSQWKGNILKAKPGQIILLFQTVKLFEDRKRNGTYVTHLVTPLDNVLRKDEANNTHPYGRFVGIISKPQNPKLTPEELSFQEPNRGAVCSVETIKVKAKYGVDIAREMKQKRLWKLFPKSDFDLDTIFNQLPSIFEEDWEDSSASEGEAKFRLALHKYYERNPEVVKAAKAKALNDNRFFCEVCTFDFSKTYPGLGEGFIECHHRIPIAEHRKRVTRIEDLAIVCSNCHRMLHRKFEGVFLTTEQLRTRFF